MKKLFFMCALCALTASCGVFKHTAKKEFSHGVYTKRESGKSQKVYVDIEDETIRMYPVKTENKKSTIDTSVVSFFYSKEIETAHTASVSFSKPSFDVDFLTIPLKYRPSQANVPVQLNTNLNGALYFGFRQDRYKVNYIANPLGKSDRHINHFGLSLGALTGLGNTFMSPTNTNDILQQEYDGIIWSKGIAAFFAINNFTIGFSVGFDNLLDKNRTIWIYENKPWLGLAFGLNLN